uniref:Uncharacterized protein n=1 Tax=viral metagenome TaxID=1070528 RepID=A0A6C0KI42_9ZZZZ
MDINNIITALDNDNNYSVANLSKAKIKCINNDILQKLQLPKETLKSYNEKLKNYRYIDDINNINMFSYIRYIKLNDPNNLTLKNPCKLYGIIEKKDKISLKCSIANKIFFCINYNEYLVFQKLSQQEEIILSIVDYLDK